MLVQEAINKEEFQEADARGVVGAAKTPDEVYTLIAGLVQETRKKERDALQRLKIDRMADSLERALSLGTRSNPAVGLGLPSSYDAMLFERARTEDSRAVQEMNDDIVLAAAICRKHPTQFRGEKLRGMWQEFQKALDTAEVSGGSEWVPTQFSSELQKRIELMLRVAAQHRIFDLRGVATGTYKVPIQTALPTIYLMGESTADAQTKWTASQPSTSNITFTPQVLAARTLYSRELDESSIVPVLPNLREMFARAFAEAIEDATLNGDTTATHQDSDVTAATDRRKAWKGYRKIAPAGSKVDAAAAVSGTGFPAKVRTLMAAMGKYAADLTNCFWVCGTNSLVGMLGLAANVSTLFAPLTPTAAQVINAGAGQVGWLYGIPVVLSGKIREDLNASGVFDNVTTTKTIMHLVHKDAFAYADWRDVRVENSDILYLETGQGVIVGSTRRDFEELVASTELAVGSLYDITKE